MPKHITKDDFKLIKGLQNAGVSRKQAKEITGRGSYTITFIYDSETMGQYKKLMTHHRTRYQKPVTPPVTDSFVAEGPLMDDADLQDAPDSDEPNPSASELIDVVKLYQDNIVQLTRMADALERVADVAENGRMSVTGGKSFLGRAR